MRKLIFTLSIVSLTLSSTAQEDATKNKAWKTGGTFAFYGGQGGSRNWASGSDRFSLSIAAYLNLYANKTYGRNLWENSLVAGYALINSSSLGIRKQDDKLDLFSKYGYQLHNAKWRVGFAANLRTQFYQGFDYSYESPRATSRFFAPAYLTLAPGFNYKLCEGLNIFGSPVAARWVIVTNQPYSFKYQGGIKPDGSAETALASLYGVNPQNKVRFEAGPYISIQVNKDIMKNVNYTSRFDALPNFVESAPEKIDLYWTNAVNMKVNKWLLVTYNFDFAYDDDVKMFGPLKNKAAAQLRSLLGVGLIGRF